MPTPQIKDRTVTLPNTYIGADVAKDWIDVFDPTRSRHERIPTDSRSLRRFALAAGQSIIVLEASGEYDRPTMAALVKAGCQMGCPSSPVPKKPVKKDAVAQSARNINQNSG